MLSIRPSAPQKCTPNLLPARINHDGPVNDAQRFWRPETDDKGTQHIHFRGRHLHGTTIALPATHTGAILNITEKTVPQQQPSQRQSDQEDDRDESLEDVAVETKMAEQIGEFEEIVVWEHGGKVDEERDGFVRGLTEWVGWAESMHADEDIDVEDKDSKA